MAVVQSTYSLVPPYGYAGMVANGETSNRISRTVEDVAGIAFGVACFRGAADHGTTATPAANKFMGVAISNLAIVRTDSTLASDIYRQGATAALLKNGVIWVNVSVACAAGDAAYVTPAGLFTNVAGGNTAIPATFDDTATGPATVRLRVVS